MPLNFNVGKDYRTLIITGPNAGGKTVASTHYGEIKNFSQNHPDFENAAMEFREETLEHV